LDALPTCENKSPHVYAGVFAVDALRPPPQLIRRLKSAGIVGVINFPSISFIDGEAGRVLEGFTLGIEREIYFLQECSAARLRIAGVTKSLDAARRLIDLEVDFLIAHGGPPTRSDP
jgi:predicted TIM-barrel enzyme